MHASRVLALTSENQPLSPLRAAAAELQYRSPSVYREKLDVIGSLDRDKLGERLQRCLLYSMQIDGSTD